MIKAANQLKNNADSIVKFYSRSAWGELKLLSEACLQFTGGYSSFKRGAPKNQKDLLLKFSKIISKTENDAFSIACRIYFNLTEDYEDFEKRNLFDLDRVVPKAQLAMSVFNLFITKHQASLPGAPSIINREMLIQALNKEGLAPFPKKSESQILKTFRVASAIGRKDIDRDIDNQKIPRQEIDVVMGLIRGNSKTILLTSGPGSGKTCLLYDLADRIETDNLWGLLFVKGDRFSKADSERVMTENGLPENIVGQCGRLSEYRRVVIIIDSLDVLSLNRSHGALKVFISLIDRLERLKNLTVVTACRTFDLTYDPMLQGRKWGHRLALSPLDYESVVAPMLIKWGVDAGDLEEEICKMICNPRHLSLFHHLIKTGCTHNIRSSYDLHNRYLEEVVVKGEGLGQQAMAILDKMAAEFNARRSLNMPKASLQADEKILQSLASIGAIKIQSDGLVEFGHQTMADCLTVRHALRNGNTLKDFILEHPQLPFIRPAVQSFFFHLRSHDPKEFSRQITAVIINDQISYHLKRLVSESIGELVPTNDDIHLVLRLFRENPELFERMLWQVIKNDWLEFLEEHWLPAVLANPEKDKWLVQFSGRLKIWMNIYPNKVIALWLQLLEQSKNPGQAVWAITIALDKFQHWDTPDIEKLLRLLVNNSVSVKSFITKPIARWVDHTGEGDHLMWEVITKGIKSEKITSQNLNNELLCNKHCFHREDFLKDRLKLSDSMMSIAINTIESWCNHNPIETIGHNINPQFIEKTSWRYIHTRHSIRGYGDLEYLFDHIEDAIKYRAEKNDTWWLKSEERLRLSPIVVFRYFLIIGYHKNLKENISGLEMIFQDSELFRYSKLDFLLGELMRKAYPLISEQSQEANQKILHLLYSDIENPEGESPVWIYRNRYEFLIQIPIIYRTKKTQDFIDQWAHRFGTQRPLPQIYSRGGTVRAPVSAEKILTLSDHGILRLLKHYNDPIMDRWEEIDGKLTGGCRPDISCHFMPEKEMV
ncbi:MAG: ATP-binding protein [Desulfobacteraceae bacterium]|nr:ATP-binding protein [Desulfobacteraceae bacterium]